MNYPIITKKYHFCASHKYGNDSWSEQKNLEVFGKDYNTHGHNYVLEVSVTGPIDAGSGWFVVLPTLNKIVKSKVVDVLITLKLKKMWNGSKINSLPQKIYYYGYGIKFLIR